MSDFRYVEVTNMRQTEVMVVWTDFRYVEVTNMRQTEVMVVWTGVDWSASTKR